MAHPATDEIRQPLTDMAASAATMVVALAQGEPLARSRLEVATELIIRASTAPPADSAP